jgi:hypothetical protein
MKRQECQSCGMPLVKQGDFGTNADGTANNEFCVYCFADGKYTDLDITMDEMLKIGLKGIGENSEISKFKKFLIKKIYPYQIKKLKRWN